MTTIQDEKLKVLAEFSAEFLKLKKSGEAYIFVVNGITYHITAPDFFYNKWFAPILAHLAKREMEKQKYTWVASYAITAHKFMWTFIDKNKVENNGLDENEYIALWSAIFEAEGGK